MQSLESDSQIRITYIDFLKFIGLTGIIIAHVGSPDGVMMLRGFDVPLMVILSAILAERSYRKYEEKGAASAKDYFISRIKRLAIPTWIFLTIYFCLDLLTGGEYRGARYYIASYCMTRYGISYVWIMLIYLYSALLIPLFAKLKLSVRGIILVVFSYCLYEAAYYLQIGAENKFLDTTFYYIVPYGVLTYLGYNFYKMNRKSRFIIAITALLICMIMGIYYWTVNGSLQSVQIVKYPPRLYYLSYGIAWTFLLILVCERHVLKIYGSPVIKYISVHSMWIYLWQILALKIYGDLNLPEIWYIKLILVYAASMAMCWLVDKVKGFLRS